MTWKVLLALLERPGGFWSYSELFERVEGIPWKDSGSCRKAYQWVRHVKDIIDKALDAWGADEKLWVEDIFNTRLGAGRVYVSPEITACIVRYQTPH